MSRSLASILIALTIASPVVAADLRDSVILGWKGDPRSVAVYTETGSLIGLQDLSGIAVAGHHRFNPRFRIVEAAPDKWVQLSLFNIDLCGYQAPEKRDVEVANIGTSRSKPASALGSGEGCKKP
jgi:hypothetical protein